MLHVLQLSSRGAQAPANLQDTINRINTDSKGREGGAEVGDADEQGEDEDEEV
jgi:hypothetical protein